MSASVNEASPLKIAVLAQLGAGLLVALLVLGMGRFSAADFTQVPLLLALLQGGLAALIAHRLQAPRWWLPIHLGFLPLVVIVGRLAIAPGWFLAAFLLLLIIFWRTDKSRVPLYLTNAATANALLKLLPATSCRFLDLGCGDGTLLRRLATARPDCVFVGIEHAPLTALVAKLRTRDLPNVTIRHGDFWDEPLGEYAVVYAFLSPVPMSRLWLKAVAEMRPGALFVSNSFAVPGIAASRTCAVSDRRATQLHLYHPVPRR